MLGAIASGLLLYGMSMIYGITGNLDIAQIASFASLATLEPQETLILNFGLVFLVIGVAFKLGAVPFHMWVPDVYQGSPTSVTMFLSTVPKIAAVALLVRLLIDGLSDFQHYWADLFMILAVLSIAVGSLSCADPSKHQANARILNNIPHWICASWICHWRFRGLWVSYFLCIRLYIDEFGCLWIDHCIKSKRL